MPSSLPLPLSTCNSTVAGEMEELSTVSTVVARSPIPVEEETPPEATPSPTASSPSPGKAVNGLSESPPPSPSCEQEIQAQEVPLTSIPSSPLAQNEAPVSVEVIQEELPAPVSQISISPTTLIPSNTMCPLAPPPGLPLLIQPPSSDLHEQGQARGANDVNLKAETTAQSSDGFAETHNPTNSRKITATGTTRFCIRLCPGWHFFCSTVVEYEESEAIYAKAPPMPLLYLRGFAVVFQGCFTRVYNAV